MGELEQLIAAGKAPPAYHVSAPEYIEAIKGSNGNVGRIAEIVGQKRHTVRQRIRDDPEVQAAYMDEYEGMMTLAEDRLFEAIDRGEPWAVKLYLTTKGAAKGYGLKMENVGSGPVIVLNWNEIEAVREEVIHIERQDARILESSTEN